MVDYNFYKNKKILVIGDTGFKGSWLSFWLTKMGANVYGFALPPEKDESLYNLLGLKNKIEHQDGDIRSLEDLISFFKSTKPEIVFHLAAQALVSKSYENPRYTFDTNIMGSVNVLDCTKVTKSVRSLIYVTSDKCYVNKEWVWGYRENDRLGGYDPYSASKASAELIFSSYLDSYFKNLDRKIGIASVRAGNVIGGGDWSAGRIIPDCVNFLKNNKTILLRKPLATRPWQHVLEPLYGYLLLAKQLYLKPRKISGSYNFGPEVKSNKTVQEIAESTIKIFGKGKIKTVDYSDISREATLLHLNCDKANNILKWFPTWSYNETIETTIKWYKEFFKGTNPLRITEENIDSFMIKNSDD